jgi:signal transduction histidine kinase
VRVLVVEDELRLAENIATALRGGPGYAVDVCFDGEDALLHVETANYDLILLDLMIPKLLGREVLRRLRNRDETTPVLILTAVSEKQSTIDLLNLGADDYMTKPFDLGELIARARTLIRRGKGVKNAVLRMGSLILTRIDHLWSEVLEAASFYVLLSIALLCVTAVVLVFLLRTLLNPLYELAGSAAGVKTDSLVFHPPASALRLRELAPLTEALSATIARLRLAFEMEHRFINDAAHELKTAVAVVRSTVQVLSMRNRTVDEYRCGLDQILSDNMRVEELIAQMLTLARFNERTELPHAKINFAEHVQESVEKLGSFSEARGVMLKFDVTTEVKVNLAPEAAHILVSNLVINAIQHSKSGTEVRVSVLRKDAGEQRATLVVQDFGSGIDAMNLAKVFDRFFREDPSRSRESGGVGLGLAICKSIVEVADGVIEIESVVGVGTSVTASLPLA